MSMSKGGEADGAGRFTLDTNILVYSIDSAAGARHDLAAEIVDRAAEQPCWLTLQSIGEFYAAVTRKGIVPRVDAAGQANDWLEMFPSIGASDTSVLLGRASGRHRRGGRLHRDHHRGSRRWRDPWRCPRSPSFRGIGRDRRPCATASRLDLTRELSSR
jgi:predicted nucleic acid-binding protein